ncbi:MAG: sulfurtransferase TusA family protein [Rhodobacter sp.]|nr:sulfurtransferase TusA family protein [Rhodobacter sp.]MCA3774274.1 sulfurtransferase TusA family protein [Cutibacterium sp.]MCA3518880.1 sulfurtransferase TusA family protein [Rhodobacter sp.]MCA3527582.1 sulfurtransferase TusA family protein [Rhodobacter sp.]MCA3530485.1 sulfurtransferase TusA family protein [Rhodobacter sp.]
MPDQTVDATNVLCPLPVIKAKKALRQMSKGQTLLVRTTDPVALIDIPHMCKQFAFELIETKELEVSHEFLIRKS